MTEPNQQQVTIQQYKNLSSKALEGTKASLSTIKIIEDANIETKVKANPTRKAVRRIVQYQDKRLLKAWQAEARKAFKKGMWIIRKGKEGKQLYMRSELVNGEGNATNLAQINKDAAKAFLLRVATLDILKEMGFTSDILWSSAGFSKLMGYKKRKRNKRRYKRYQRKARKSFRRMRKHRGRRLRYRMKRRRGGRKSYRRRRTTRRRSYRRRR